MLENKPNKDDLDLSEMIDEYDEDSELRKKIEAMKQGKKETAEVKPDDAMRSVRMEDTALIKEEDLSSTMELPIHDKRNQSAFIDVDDVEATKVLDPIHTNDLDENEKTLVIMGNAKQRVFHEEASQEQDSVHLYNNQEIDEEELTEEDIEEFLEEEAKQPRDPKKMNKIITYVIVGILALCVLVGVGFGVKALIDSNNSDPKQEEPSKKPEENAGKDQNNEENNNQTNQNGETSNTDKNAKRIAEINGLLKEYRAQIDELNQKIETAESDIKKAEGDIEGFGDPEKKFKPQCDEANKSVDVVTITYQKAKDELAKDPNNKELQEKARIAEEAYNDSLEAQKNFCNAYQSAVDNVAEANKRKSEAEATKAECLNAITKLQNKITDLQNERDSLGS